MRGRTSALVSGVALLTLGGCSSLSGDLYADQADLTRAQTIWQDPWVAPSTLSVPGASYGSNGLVDRTAGSRETTYVGLDARDATAQEVAVAGQTGWVLVGASCDDDRVRAVLTRGGTDPTQAAAAEVLVDDPGSARDGSVSVAVTAQVPHHLDEDWPDLGPAVPLDDTCLAGGSAGPAPDLPGGKPRGPADDDVDVPEWSDDAPGRDDESRVAALTADSWYASLGVAAPELPADGGDRSRAAPATQGTLTPGPRQPVAALASVVDTMTGWQPTYASCSRATGGIVTLRLESDDGPVVARLEAVPRNAGQVSWTVTLPVVDGPDQSWVDEVPPLDDGGCLDARRAPRAPESAGVPVGLITSLQPLQ